IRSGAGSVRADSPELGAFSSGREITIVAGRTYEVDLELDLAAEVSGDVVDASGAPVRGAYVRLRLAGGPDRGECMTGEAGRFRCLSMSGGGDYLISVYPSPTAGTPFRSAGGPHPRIRVGDGRARVTGVRLAIEHDRLAIRGRVIDPDGAPVVDARVVAEGRERPSTTDRPSLAAARSDLDGGFAVGDLAPGAYTLRVRSARGDAVVDQIAAGSGDVLVVIEPFGAIEGTLSGFDPWLRVTARNQDLTRQGVEVGQVRARDGSFRFAALPAGIYYVSAQGRRDGVELDAAAVSVQPGATARLALANRGTAVIRGVVVEHRSGAPVAGMFCNATASVEGSRANNMVLGHPGDPGHMSDAAGHFELSPAPAGEGVRIECWSGDDRLSHAAIDRAVPRGGTLEVVLRSVRRRPGEVDIGHTYEPWLLPARVWRVEPDGPAADAGLEPGDRLAAVGGESVEELGPDGVAALVENQLAGGSCALTVFRDATRRELTLRAP
ncbi:MAG TPA: carboxypeptidase regulatory-like domain-containing protein, partial [Kofleriaceae bacterium]|nr:carboxypeptidase regulatory-like domain-containing protein [Kofleriaceae bacterium]